MKKQHLNLYTILFTIFVLIITSNISQGQELTQNKKGWLKQKSLAYAGLGTAIPSEKPAYHRYNDFYGAAPVPLVGLNAAVGITYFFTKHWGINAELNGDYYLNNNANKQYQSFGSAAHKSNWVDAHALITPIYSIRLKKLAIDLKMTAGINVVHLGPCSVTNANDSTKVYQQSKINQSGLTIGYGIRGRYVFNSGIGCFVSVDNIADASIWGSSITTNDFRGTHTNRYWSSEFTYYTIQVGIHFFLGKNE
jgi:hypothetical protein